MTRASNDNIVIEQIPMPVRWSSHGVRRDILKAAFGDWFGIEPAATDVLIALFEAPGRVLTWQELASATDSHRPPTRPALWQRVCDLRKAMHAEAIDTSKNEGYSLTEVGRRECRLAISDMAGRLAAIGSGEAA